MLAYLIVTGTLLLQRQQSLAQINSDGFNIYKDLLRSKSDEPYSFFEQGDDPNVLVYRAPSLFLVPAGDTGVEKRGANHFKSFMLSPQREPEMEMDVTDKQDDHRYHFPRVLVKKRSVDHYQPSCRWPDHIARFVAKRASILGQPLAGMESTHPLKLEPSSNNK